MGRRNKSEYGRSYKLKWDEALHQQYSQIVEYRRYRKAREFRHEPFVWEEPPEDDSTSQSTGSVGVASSLDDERRDVDEMEDERNQFGPSNGEEGETTDIERETEVRQTRRPRKRRGNRRSRVDKSRVEQQAAGESELERKDRKPPFHPYGWANNAIGNVTNRRTYNVKAPQEEVYPSALRALKRKQADEHIRDELRQRRSLERKRLEGAFNLGTIRREKEEGIWLTEYQRSYSGTPRQGHVNSVMH